LSFIFYILKKNEKKKDGWRKKGSSFVLFLGVLDFVVDLCDLDPVVVGGGWIPTNYFISWVQ
jgi:hypothetical protein